MLLRPEKNKRTDGALRDLHQLLRQKRFDAVFFACFDICQKIGIHGFRHAEILFLKVDAVGADLDRIER